MMSADETKTLSGSDRTGTSTPVIPDFQLVRSLGSGGFGEVWLARSLTGVYRAVKVIPKGTISDIEFAGIRAYEKHIRGHAHLVEVMHVGETPDHLHFYYVMELADSYTTAPTFSCEDYEARTLKSDLKRNDHLSLDEALVVARQILEGLDDLHVQELLHRDIKPANIIFVNQAAKLADLGLVSRVDRQAAKAYTPLYAPPEGVVDRSGDLYCLGKVLFEMVTGTSPRLSPELPNTSDPERRASFRRIMPIVDRACTPDPKDRFQTAAEFKAAIDEISPPEGTPMPTKVRSRGRLATIGVTAMVLLLLTWATRTWRVIPTPNAPALHVLVKESGDAADFHELAPENLPLKTGQLLSLHVSLPDPMYPLVAVVSEDKGVQIAYPLSGQVQESVTNLTVPLPAGRWWVLEPPEGTITFVLLASRAPISDTDAIRLRLADLGKVPNVAPDAMMRLIGDRVAYVDEASRRSRSIDVGHTVAAEAGFLEDISVAFGQEFQVITAVTARQVPGSGSNHVDPDG